MGRRSRFAYRKHENIKSGCCRGEVRERNDRKSHFARIKKARWTCKPTKINKTKRKRRTTLIIGNLYWLPLTGQHRFPGGRSER